MYQVLGHYPIDGYEFSDLSDTIVHLRSRHYKTIVEREKEAKKEAAKSRYKAVLDKAIADLHSKPKEQKVTIYRSKENDTSVNPEDIVYVDYDEIVDAFFSDVSETPVHDLLQSKMNAKRKARVQHFLDKKKAKTTASCASVNVNLTASDGETKSEGFTTNVTFAAEVKPARKSPREPATLIRFKPGGEYSLIEVSLCCLQFVSSLSFRQVFPNSEA